MFANIFMPEPPDQKVEVAELFLSPILALVVGYAIWWFFQRREIDGGKRWLKWIGIVPLVAVAIYGLRYIGYVNNVMYMSIDGMLGTGNKVKLPHYAPTVLSGLGALGMVVWGWLSSRHHQDDY